MQHFLAVDTRIELWVKKSCRSEQNYCDSLMDDTAETVFRTYPNLSTLDGMLITATNRFDLGLASGNMKWSKSLPIEQWKERINWTQQEANLLR